MHLHTHKPDMCLIYCVYKPVSVCNNVLPGQTAKSQKNKVRFCVVNLHIQPILEFKVDIYINLLLACMKGLETAQTAHYVGNILQPWYYKLLYSKLLVNKSLVDTLVWFSNLTFNIKYKFWTSFGIMLGQKWFCDV